MLNGIMERLNLLFVEKKTLFLITKQNE